MKEIDFTIKLKPDQDFVEVYVLGDTHFGNKFHDPLLFNIYYGEMLREENYIVSVGDLMESAVDGSLGEKDQKERIDQQYIKLRKLLKPIRKRVIGMVKGNHEERLIRQNFDINNLLHHDLGIANLGDMGVINIHLKKGKKQKTYRMMIAHGVGASRTEGGKLNAVMRLVKIVSDADIYVMGHLHDRMAVSKPIFTKDGIKDRIFGITGAFLEYGGYAERALYSPPSRGCLKVKLHFDMDRVSAR